MMKGIEKIKGKMIAEQRNVKCQNPNSKTKAKVKVEAKIEFKQLGPKP